MRSLERQTAKRAVQYLRMSTDHQRYSLENQAAAIATYASERGLQIVGSYEDPGRSGLTLKERPGLQRLLSDCMRPGRDFSTILVLDVSRWGRFQDIDEAAHYEFICRQAGVRVIYCAEPFQDDGRPMSSLIKHLKRVMAAEYSRELSAKLTRARLQQARLGFRQGGVLPYRLLKPAYGAPSYSLVRRRFGSLTRCYELAGLPHEVSEIKRAAHVRRRERLHGGMAPEAMLEALRVLWERHGRLSQNIIGQSREAWSVPCYGRVFGSLRRAYDLIGYPSPRYFNVRDEGRRTSDAYLLQGLRRLIDTHGYASGPLVDADPELPSQSVYRERFGSMLEAYRLAGWNVTRGELASLGKQRKVGRQA